METTEPFSWLKHEAELKREDKQHSEQELGDFLFSVINAARLYHLNPDNALEETNQKFIRRFNYIEEHSIKMGKPLTEMTLAEMDALWNEAKEKFMHLAVPVYGEAKAEKLCRLIEHLEKCEDFAKDLAACLAD